MTQAGPVEGVDSQAMELDEETTSCRVTEWDGAPGAGRVSAARPR